MKTLWYEAGRSYKEQKKAADKRHTPLLMKLKLKATEDDLIYKAGPIDLTISAGALERCRRLSVPHELSERMTAGTVYRISGGNNYMEMPRIVVKLRWQDSKGYFAGKGKHHEEPEEHIFSIPEDVFLKGMVGAAS